MFYSKHTRSKTSSHSNKVTPGWNDNARKLREDGLSWHHFWNTNGRPKDGHIAEMHRVKRARYHREIRHLKKNAVKNKMQKCLMQLCLIKLVTFGRRL